MEINGDFPNEHRQSLYIQSKLYHGNQLPSLLVGRDSKSGRGMQKLCSRKKKKASDMPTLEAYYRGNTVGEITRSTGSYVLTLRRMFGFV